MLAPASAMMVQARRWRLGGPPTRAPGALPAWGEGCASRRVQIRERRRGYDVEVLAPWGGHAPRMIGPS